MQIYAVFTLKLERLVCEDSGLGTRTHKHWDLLSRLVC